MLKGQSHTSIPLTWSIKTIYIEVVTNEEIHILSVGFIPHI